MKTLTAEQGFEISRRVRDVLNRALEARDIILSAQRKEPPKV